MKKRMRETQGLLKDYWYVAARAQDVTAKKPLGRTLLEELIVLYRTKAGVVVAMADRCLHRNALLSHGTVFDDCIGCPYHGWTYDTAGRCVNVPSEGRDGSPNVDRRLETFPVREQDGLVWVWMGGGPPDKEPFSMPRWETPGWGAYYMVTKFQNGITHLVENFMDVPHTVFVHEGWFRRRKKTRVRTKVERTKGSVLVTYDQPGDSIGVTSRILNPRKLPMTHTDKFYMPSVTRVDYAFGDEERAFIITSACTPMKPFETMVYTLISFKLGSAIANWLGARLLPPYTRKVIEQDVDIMEIQGRSLQHHGEERFHSTPADALHLHIEALRGWALAGGTTPAPLPVVEEMEFWI